MKPDLPWAESQDMLLGQPKKNHSDPIPHVSGGSTKARLTVMYCGSAEGQMMPPFYVYPNPKPKEYDPMAGSLRGSVVEYTPKGWMDGSTFRKFMEHFDKNCGEDRPVLLLIDSVSSHVSMETFSFATLPRLSGFHLTNVTLL